MASHFNFQAIGTTWNIDIPADFDAKKEQVLLQSIKDRIAQFDSAYSRFRKDSLVASIARRAGRYVFPADALPMMDLYKELYILTGGLMTPLIGQVLSDAGYDAEYSLKPKSSIASAPRWEDVIEYKHPNILTKKPVILDFGALGKGYLIDIVAGVIRDHGIKNYTVDAGGDIAYFNEASRPLHVGLEDPEDSKQIIGTANIINQSICGSAGNRRAWNKFHHIINPETVESPRHIIGLWVLADTTILADALATALFFVEPDRLTTKYKFEFAIFYEDHSARLSPDFPGELFTA